MGTRVVVRCSVCGKELPLLPAFIPGAEFRQWYGNACTTCGRVYCPECIAVGRPTRCAACGEPTKGTALPILREAGVLV